MRTSEGGSLREMALDRRDRCARSLGTATVANWDDSGTATIPGCAPQCLPPHLIEPGNLPAGKYQTRYFFAGEMTLLVREGLALWRRQHR